MPELPEIETIKLGLQKYLIGHRIESVEIRFKKIFYGNPYDVIGGRFVTIKRFGKGLSLELDNGYSLAVHIKLTGQIIYRGPDLPLTSQISRLKVGSLPNNWTHVIFHLDNGGLLYYNDLRQFGWIRIIRTFEVNMMLFFRDMGPEPFGDLTLERFQDVITSANERIIIKPLLMNQKKIGGIGNIYANESLYLAKILPTRQAESLTKDEITKLYKTVEIVMRNGLQYGGASQTNYVNAFGEEGDYQNHFLIFAQEGKPCQICGKLIKKIVLHGKATYFCSGCQK